MLTSFLEVLALLLFVAGALVFGGPALALVVAGCCCLVASWALTRPRPRR